jgi:hypothetical protein
MILIAPGRGMSKHNLAKGIWKKPGHATGPGFFIGEWPVRLTA